VTVLLDRDGLAAGFRSRGPAAASTAGALTPLDLLARVFPRTVRTPALELVNDAVVWAEATPDARLIVTLAPQESKSSTVTRAGSLYMLRQDPTRRIVIASYADRLARRWGRTIRNDIAANSGQRGGLDLGLRLAADARARDEWELVTGGGVMAVGARSGLTGKAADVMIIDDPVKDRKEAESPTVSEDTWDWWTSTASTRLAPGAPVILVLTRWSHNDLAGRLLRAQPGEWRVVHIPAQADPLILDPDPLGRPAGEFMVSARGRTREQWERRKRDAGADWTPLYQGAPVDPGGETFDVDKLGWWRLTPDGQAIVLGPNTWRLSECRRFGTVDTASSTSSAADFTVAAAWAVTPAGDLVLLDVRRERVPEHRQVGLAEPLAARWGLDCTYVESTMAGTRLVRDMVQAGRRIQDLRADRSKTARAALAASWVDQGRVAFPAQGMAASLPDAVLTDVLEELRHFPAGRHDDFVDNLAYAAAVTLDTYLPPDSGQWEPVRREAGVSESAFGAEPIDDLMSRPF